jgi:DNA-binding GntR family transcriptional regulator
VSRTPLREALLALEREGFVRADVARGFAVAPLSARDVREVYPILLALESLALRMSGPMAFTLVELLTAANTALASAPDARSAQDCDHTFHRILLSRSPNARLLDLIAAQKRSVERYERLYRASSAYLSITF